MSKQDYINSEAEQLHRQLDTNEKYWTQENSLICAALTRAFERGYTKGYRRLGVKEKIFKPTTPKKPLVKDSAPSKP